MYSDSPEFILIFMPLIYLLLGIIFTIVSNVSKNNILKKMEIYTSTTNGTLTKWNHHVSIHSSGETGWYPVFEYDVNGQHYVREENISRTKRGESPVAAVIHYNPSKPHEFYSNSELYFKRSKIFMIAGIGFIAFSILTFIIIVKCI